MFKLNSLVVLQQTEQLSTDSVCIVARAEEQPSSSSDIPSVKKTVESNFGCDVSQPMSDEVENMVEPDSFCTTEGEVLVEVLQETVKSCQSKEPGPTQKGNYRKRKFQDVSIIL